MRQLAPTQVAAIKHNKYIRSAIENESASTRNAPNQTIGKDTRPSGYMFEKALTVSLCSVNVHILLVGCLWVLDQKMQWLSKQSIAGHGSDCAAGTPLSTGRSLNHFVCSVFPGLIMATAVSTTSFKSVKREMFPWYHISSAPLTGMISSL